MELKEARERLIAKIRIKLLYLSDEELLDSVLRLNKENLNNQIEDGGFPVWDIAYRLKSNGWKVSKNQKKGIINVLSYYMTDKIMEEALKKKKQETHL